MLIFLYGEDTYRSRQKLNQIIEHYSGVHKQGVNLQNIDCAQLEFADLKGMLQTNSLFREKRLLILKNIFAGASLAKGLFENKKLLERSEDNIVFFEEGTPKAGDSFFQFLKKQEKCQKFAPLENSSLKKWIAREFQTYQAKADPMAIEILASQIGSDLWHMSQEIKKLAAYSKSHNSFVQEADVQYLAERNLETNIFFTLDNIAQKNKKAALEQIASHLQKGESPLYLLSMFSFQFRNLLLLRDMMEKRVPYQLLAKKTGLHPFVVKKGLALAQKFTFGELKKIYQKIFELDLGIKRGLFEPSEAIQLFIAQL